jgi:hypothetical protein
VEEPELNPGGEPPEDDRNDEVEGSPVPDPTEEDPGTDELPGAD